MTEDDLKAIEARMEVPGCEGRYVGDADDAKEDVTRLLAEVRALRAALDGLVDDERCSYDHHGNCQTHGIGKPCEMAVARAALGLESLA